MNGSRNLRCLQYYYPLHCSNELTLIFNLPTGKNSALPSDIISWKSKDF